MNPLCQFCQWSSEDIAQLMKIKETIQDVDGECSFKVSGQTCKGCNVAVHYYIRLHALNKKFGLYKRIVVYLDALSYHNTAHMNDIQIAFMEDAAQSKDALQGDFRSPAFNYYIWLDHTGSGFHVEYCEALELELIYKIVDWCAYHNKECKEHDCCEALQGCGGGEDVQHLLDAVDASLNALNASAVPEAGTEPISLIHNILALQVKQQA
ncbi:hypothetical protein EDB19DRAFT_1831169 [Suillus lakei]|nr:hypothetical protein EDB19DRAFT_1831169 [Suillus lakei]